MMGLLRRLAGFVLGLFDRFTIGIFVCVLIGLLLPCYGRGADVFEWLTQIFIMIPFFFYGVRIERAQLVAGLLHWRLQLTIFAFTFVLFPLFMFAVSPLLAMLVTPLFLGGFLYLACLPSTVQGCVVFTSIAGGNVAAAVCSAPMSSILGIVLSPLLVSLLFETTGMDMGVSLDAIQKVCLFVLLPFVVGQLVQRWVRPWSLRHKSVLGWADQTPVWLVVYTAFSEATVSGFWWAFESVLLLRILLGCILTVSLMQTFAYLAARWLGFNRADRIAIVFCGPKKSLAVGAPMMLAIFGSFDKTLVLPLMLYHQAQTLFCASLARYWSSRVPEQES